MEKRHFEDLSELECNNLASIITDVNNDPKKTHKLRSYFREVGLSDSSIAKVMGFKEPTKAERKHNLERKPGKIKDEE